MEIEMDSCGGAPLIEVKTVTEENAVLVSTPLEHRPDNAADFEAQNQPFAFSPGQLNKLLNPKSLSAYKALGGFKDSGTEVRTNTTMGSNIDEDISRKETMFDDRLNEREDYLESAVDEFSSCDRSETRRVAQNLFVVDRWLKSNCVYAFLVFLPLSVLSGFLGYSHTLQFVLSFITIIPLAALLSYATEEVFLKTGEILGEFLSATLGGTSELILNLLGLHCNDVLILGPILSTIFIRSQSVVSFIIDAICIVVIVHYGSLLWTDGKSFMRVGPKYTRTICLCATHATCVCEEEEDTIAPNTKIPRLVRSWQLWFPGLAFLFILIATSDCVVVAHSQQQFDAGLWSWCVALTLLVVYLLYLFFQLKQHCELYNDAEAEADSAERKRYHFNTLDPVSRFRGFAAPEPSPFSSIARNSLFRVIKHNPRAWLYAISFCLLPVGATSSPTGSRSEQDPLPSMLWTDVGQFFVTLAKCGIGAILAGLMMVLFCSIINLGAKKLSTERDRTLHCVQYHGIASLLAAGMFMYLLRQEPDTVDTIAFSGVVVFWAASHVLFWWEHFQLHSHLDNWHRMMPWFLGAIGVICSLLDTAEAATARIACVFWLPILAWPYIALVLTKLVTFCRHVFSFDQSSRSSAHRSSA